MKIGVVSFPGANSSEEIVWLYKRHFNVDVDVLSANTSVIRDLDGLIIPGGFSYGDALRPGAMVKATPVAAAIFQFCEHGKHVLGIGNGFQILCELGVLPGMLMVNPDMSFTGGLVNVAVENTKAKMLEGILSDSTSPEVVLKMPVGCYFGQYYIEPRMLRELDNEGRVAFRYVDKFGHPDKDRTFLGSVDNVAGVLNKKKNVLGMMPRPELAIDKEFGSDDGLRIFESFLKNLVHTIPQN